MKEISGRAVNVDFPKSELLSFFQKANNTWASRTLLKSHFQFYSSFFRFIFFPKNEKLPSISVIDIPTFSTVWVTKGMCARANKNFRCHPRSKLPRISTEDFSSTPFAPPHVGLRLSLTLLLSLESVLSLAAGPASFCNSLRSYADKHTWDLPPSFILFVLFSKESEKMLLRRK